MRTVILVLAALGCSPDNATTPSRPSPLGSIDAMDVLQWMVACPSPQLGGLGTYYELRCARQGSDAVLRFERASGCVHSIMIDDADEASARARLAELDALLDPAKTRSLQVVPAGEQAFGVSVGQVPGLWGTRVLWLGRCPRSSDASDASPFGRLHPARAFALQGSCRAPLATRSHEGSFELVCTGATTRWELHAHPDGQISSVMIEASREPELRDVAIALIPSLVPERYYGRFTSSLLARDGEIVPTWEAVVSIGRLHVTTDRTWILWRT